MISVVDRDSYEGQTLGIDRCKLDAKEFVARAEEFKLRLAVEIDVGKNRSESLDGCRGSDRRDKEVDVDDVAADRREQARCAKSLKLVGVGSIDGVKFVVDAIVWIAQGVLENGDRSPNITGA